MRASWSNSPALMVGRLLWSAVMRYRQRTLIALLLVVLAKLATVAVPLALKEIVDRFGNTGTALVLPVFLLLAYALLRFSSTLFGEIRDMVFARVTHNSVSSFLLEAFAHLHRLSVRFHAVRRTGALTRDVERGTAGIGFLLGVALFTVLPTLVEICAVIAVMSLAYSQWFTVIILVTFLVYGAFTIIYTERRAIHQRALNELDSTGNSRLVDSLLNFETVKFYTNERYEYERFGGIMREWIEVAVRNQKALFFLHVGQSGIIACGVAGVMLLAGQNVVEGTMTVGDLVLVNAYVIQVCLPLNSLGFVFRQARDAIVNAEKMFRLMQEAPEITDPVEEKELVVQRGEVRFEHIDFAYEPSRQILWDVSLTIPPGGTVAVVGGSGSGKSTLARLLFRFYDASAGRITIDGQDVREVTQRSLRAAIGIVPQDTILFNDTIAYNIAYGRPGASLAEVIEAARAAHVHDFIAGLPDQYDTLVGERGVKLSGGEKQRIAIARAILKNPPILVFDEATSALDTRSERAIQDELDRLARERTTLVIAHRLSTVVDADEILVLEHGRVIERGTHDQLLRAEGLYAQMWRLQRQQQELEKAEQVLALQPVNLVALAADVIDGLKAALDARSIGLFTSINVHAARITADPAGLHQALWTLVEQAVAASPLGARMELRVDRIGTRGRLSLMHSVLPGQGPPRQPTRDDPDRVDVHGIEAMITDQGGTISARSAAAGTVSIVIEFPLRSAAEVAAPAPPLLGALPAGGETAALPSLAGVSVLLTGSDGELRSRLESAFQTAGADTRIFASGEEAASLLDRSVREEWPDLIVCEVAPDEDEGAEPDDGYEVIQRLRQIEAERGLALRERVPAIALAPEEEGEHETRALLFGFQACLPKTVAPAELVATAAVLADRGGRRPAGDPRAGGQGAGGQGGEGPVA